VAFCAGQITGGLFEKALAEIILFTLIPEKVTTKLLIFLICMQIWQIKIFYLGFCGFI
jgi:hypothetical protein